MPLLLPCLDAACKNCRPESVRAIFERRNQILKKAVDPLYKSFCTADSRIQLLDISLAMSKC